MATAVQPARVMFRFADFEFSGDALELRKFGLRLKLQRKPLLLLLALLENAGEVVAREQLHSALWPEDTFVDFELGLNVAVKKLRDALSDSAEAPRYIETVVGQGYRFIAHVERVAYPASERASSTAAVIEITPEAAHAAGSLSTGKTALSRWKRSLLWVAMLVLTASVSLGAWWRTEHILRFHAKDWVLITDFDNRTGEAVLDGTLESALRTELSNSQFVSVAPRERVNDVLRLMKLRPDTRVDEQRGREICVRDGAIQAMLTGRIVKLGSEYDVTVFLVNPKDGATIAGEEQHARSQEALLSAIHAVGKAVLGDLGEHDAEVRGHETKLEKASTSSLEALYLYSRADTLMKEGGLENQKAAEALLRQAVARDPQFASALNLLAWSMRNQGRDKTEYLPVAEQAFHSADSVTDREAGFIRGSYYQFTGDSDRALAAYGAIAEAYPDDYWSANNAFISAMNDAHEEEGAHWATHLSDLRPNDPMSAERAWIASARDKELAQRFRDRLIRLRQAGESLPPPTGAVLDWSTDVIDLADRGDIAGAVAQAGAIATPANRMLEEQYFANSLPADFAFSVGQLKKAEGSSSSSQWWMRLLIADGRGDSAAFRKIALAASTPPPDRGSFDGRAVGAVLLARAGYLRQARVQAAHGLKYFPVYQWWFTGVESAAQGHFSEAIPNLQKAVHHFSITRQGRFSFFAAEDLAHALDHAARTQEAIEVLEPFEKDHRFDFLSSYGPSLDRLLLAQLYRKKGHIDDAKRIEGELLALWRYADADFQLLIQLKRQAGVQ